jgi:hypothetical protein
MTRPISARVHGVLDYAFVAIFLNAPMVFGFQHTTASAIAYWLTGIHLLLTGCTDFPLGAFKWIPFKIHGAIELVAGLFVLVAPWIFGFYGEGPPRNFFIAMGVIILIVVALTDYSVRVDLPIRQPGDRRHWGMREPGSDETPKTS